MSDEIPNTQRPLHSDEETLQLALAAAEAIKRLIAERDELRGRLVSQELEVARLREHVGLIRDSYRRLAHELVSQLELVDKIDSEVGQETAGLVKFPRFLRNLPPKAS
jgi:predicted nuclease with TOPRIM domain